MMATKFRIFSTEQGPSLAPDELSVLPVVLIVFDHDPIKAGVQISRPEGRGSVTRTGGSVVFQDYGLVEGGGTITLNGSVSEGDYLLPATVQAIDVIESVVDGVYYFTDGVSCWKVRFSRSPRGFNRWYDSLWAALGRIEYSYSLNLLIVENSI